MHNKNEFSDYLREQFIAKVKINKNFSLRSYARFLDIHFATLSQFMSGKRAITKKTIRKLAPRLNATDEHMSQWLSSIEKKSAPNFIQYKTIDQEQLALLSEWYYDAIVELVQTKHFRKDIAWIAKVFNISYIEADEAVACLFKLGLLGVNEQGDWIVINQLMTTITNNQNTSAALKNYQAELLKKSLNSIELVPFEDRTHSSLVVAISKDQLAEFNVEIDRLRSRLNQMATSQLKEKKADSVYCFCFSGFPVSQI